MYKTDAIVIAKRDRIIFNLLLMLYPASFRKHYSREMNTLFEDLYKEELENHGRITLRFWILQVVDIIKGSVSEHIHMIRKRGLLRHLMTVFHLDQYNVLGGILLLPVLVMVAIDGISRIIQGDLIHYNRPVYTFLSHTPLYWFPVLFTWVILFPLCAVILNMIPLAKKVIARHGKVLNRSFVIANGAGIIVIMVGLSLLAMIKLHDFVPCMIHGLLQKGAGFLFPLLNRCRNA